MRRDKIETGRPLAGAFLDHGVQFPQAPEPPAPVKDDVAFPALPTRHGRWAKGHGWAAVGKAPLRTYRSTTAEIGGVFPFLTDKPLPRTGANAGINKKTGAGFYVDMRRWVREGYVSNTNILCTGKPGQGKSGVTKPLLLRSMAYGDKALIIGDLKDEYTDLCEYTGNPAIAVAPGLFARVNPMDGGPLLVGWDGLGEDERRARLDQMRARWLVLLPGLLDARHVTTDATSMETLTAVLDDLVGANRGSLRTAPEVTIPEVWHALRNPTQGMVDARKVFNSMSEFVEVSRPLVDGLGGLINGELKGLFDAPTNITIDWDAPMVSLALRGMKRLGDSAIGVALTALSSWASSMNAVPHTLDDGSEALPSVRWMVRDEAWRAMRMGPNAVKSLDADLRLGRDDSFINMLVMHKMSDMASAGQAGSHESQIASDMAALCDTKILLAQDADVAEAQGTALGLSSVETDLLTDWCWGEKGRALWRVGSSSIRVQTVWSPLEKRLFETNDKWEEQGVAA